MASASSSATQSHSIAATSWTQLKVEHDKGERGLDVYLIATPLTESLAQIFFPVEGREQFMHWSLLCIFDPDPEASDVDEDEPEHEVRVVELLVGSLDEGQEFAPTPDHHGMGGLPQPAFLVQGLGRAASFISGSSTVASSLEEFMFNYGTCVQGGFAACDKLIAHPEELGARVLNEKPLRATISPKKLRHRAMKEHMMNNSQYNAVTNNCQHWVLRMLQMLHAHDGDGDYNVSNQFVPLDRAGGLPKILAGGAYSNLQAKVQKKLAKFQSKLDKF